jgi:hypothetical protein
MDKISILGIIEKIYDTYGDNLVFQRDDVAAIMFGVLGKSSTISDGRNINTLIHLKLIEVKMFPYFKLTKQAVSLLRENNRILNLKSIEEAEKLEAQEPEICDSDLADYIPDKTKIIEPPEGDKNG